MVTHDRNEAYRNCGGICIINDGRTEKILNTKEFMECPKTVGAARISGCKNIYRFEKTQKENVIFGSVSEYIFKDGRNYKRKMRICRLESSLFPF